MFNFQRVGYFIFRFVPLPFLVWLAGFELFSRGFVPVLVFFLASVIGFIVVVSKEEEREEKYSLYSK